MNLENKLLQKSKIFLRNALLTGMSIVSLSCGKDPPTKPPITQLNNPPSITSTPINEIGERFNYQYPIRASDADGDKLTFSLVEKPEWVSINSGTGEISGLAPEVQSDSTFSVKAKVSDGKASAEHDYNLLVKNISNTHVVTEESPERIMSVGEDRITFSGSPQFSEGDIIAAGITEETPYGLLRKVESVSGGVIYTSQATLEETIKHGSFEFSGKIIPSNVNKNAARKGVSFYQTSLFDIGLNLDNVVLHDGVLGQTTANGNVGLDLSYDIKMDVDDWKLQNLLFTLIATGKYDLNIKSLVAFSGLEEKISFNDLIPIPPFTIGVIPLGPITIPVIVYPQIGLDVGVSGNIGELETGISQEVSFTAGLKYENGSWSPIADFSNEFDFDSPTIKIQNLDFRAFAGPTIKFPIYNVAGPYGSVPGFIGFETDEKGWVVSGGLEALLGVHAQIFGRTLADYSAKVFEMKKVVGGEGFVGDGGSGDGLIQLTFGPEEEYWPRASPGGTRIVFVKGGKIYI
ncbi:MAG: hypothetical protein KKB29_03365, partial [Nanoarchaeota archaeon]|nr:hypothetical protein [Nanoarchaeota archaeon]